MSDIKISQLPAYAEASWATNDLVPIVDTASAITKKTTIADFDTRYPLKTTVTDVPHGGTGNSTLNAHGVLIGEGTSAVAVTGTGLIGQVLTSNGIAADPTFQSPATNGTVTSVSVVTSNGLAGTVANPTTTPAITLSTTITGLLKGNGTAISAAAAGSDYQAAGNYITALTGDVLASGPGSANATLATVASAGTTGSSTSIPSVTINAKGLVTSATGNAVVAPAGTLTGTVLASNVVTSSLTAVATLITGVWQATTVALGFGGTGATTASGAFKNIAAKYVAARVSVRF